MYKKQSAAVMLPLNVMSVLKKRPSLPTIFREAALDSSFPLRTKCLAASCEQQRRLSPCWFPSEGSGPCDWSKHSHVTGSASRLESVDRYILIKLQMQFVTLKHRYGHMVYTFERHDSNIQWFKHQFLLCVVCYLWIIYSSD